MDVIVCVKQVPDYDQVKIADETIDPKLRTLVREGIPSILNPFDEYAVEEAIRIKEQVGGTVTALTMGSSRSKDALIKCLAMGADRSVLLDDEAFRGADTLITSLTLAAAIKQQEFDMILCGKQAIDGDTGHVGIMIAECLGIPHINRVRKLKVNQDKKSVVAHREVDDGLEVVKCPLPAVIIATKGLNEPRYPSITKIMRARKKEMVVLSAASLELDPSTVGWNGSPTQIINIEKPESRAAGVKVSGDDVDEAVDQLIKFMEERNLL